MLNEFGEPGTEADSWGFPTVEALLDNADSQDASDGAHAKPFTEGDRVKGAETKRRTGRKRHVTRLLRMTPEEWEQIERNYKYSGMDSFAAFSRTMLLYGTVTVTNAPLSVEVVRSIIHPLANNLNQIARQVNTNDAVTSAEAGAAHVTLKRIEEMIVNYLESQS